MELPAKTPCFLRLFTQHFGFAIQRLKKTGGEQFHPLEQNIRLMGRESSKARHSGRPVHECQSFFALQHGRSESGIAQSINRLKPLVFKLRLADADQKIREMSQWNKVSTRAQRTFARNFGQNAAVQGSQ